MERMQERCRVRAASVASLLALLGCAESVEEPAGPPTPDTRVAKRFDASALAIIGGATEAEAYRLGGDGSLTEEEATGKQRLGRFDVALGPVRPDAGWLRRLRSVLFDDTSYEWKIAKACRPNPGIAVRYRQGADEVHLYLCFECDMLQIGRPGAERWADFDPGRAELIRLVRELFPADPTILSLKEKN